MAIDLNAQKRDELGSGCSYRLREQKILPAVLYGKEIETQSVQVNGLEMERLLRTKLGQNTFINLKIEGDKEYGVLVKAIQGDAITRQLTHVDFWNVKEDREVEVTIETRVVGKAPGLLKGGILEHTHHTVRLICRADSIPEDLEVSLDSLEVGENIHLSDLDLPKGVTAKAGYNPTIVSMVEEKRRAAAEEADAAVGVPAAEGAEGEAAAPAAGDAAAAPAADAKAKK